MGISESDFNWVRALVQLRTGVVLDSNQSYLVEHRLESIAEQHGFPSLRHLFYRLRHASDFPLRQSVVEAMMTNETYFFRDAQPFELLRRDLLPTLIGRRRDERKLSIWSAACSSGQEVYSVALLMRNAFPELRNWGIDLLGTDLASKMIDRARRGEYSSLELSRGLPDEYRRSFFAPRRDGWVIDESIRRMVEFEEQNLLAPWPSREPFDLIFLRNVLIYFDLPTKRALLDRICKAMRPDGFLILGGSETTLNLGSHLIRVDRFQSSYYRLAESARESVSRTDSG